MGLERMAAIMQGVQSNYETDVLRDLVAVGERLSGASYRGGTNATVGDGAQAKVDLSLRICADHSRSVAFMIADGILPSNEGRGYVLRRLLRRAVMRARRAHHPLRGGALRPHAAHGPGLPGRRAFRAGRLRPSRPDGLHAS